CADIVNSVPGNSALFFPSYSLRDQINLFFKSRCKKTTFLESSVLSKEEKAEMLDNFKSYKDKTGAVLLGVASGNFSEGIDLPGVLKCVIVVGLPLQPPDVETKELIAYYDKKFSKGWDYGYIFPAINKCLQSSGRCIRNETDRGVLVFLDERFAWNNYFKCFPADWDMVVTKNYSKLIKAFFEFS
ncbi:MAG: helicase C-terminal domain-containing protein, partial [Nanoarchaeota archaeon]|nr:helicase C-terminal domain-containing protein [Nanoarchaeota archaeon]